MPTQHPLPRLRFLSTCSGLRHLPSALHISVVEAWLLVSLRRALVIRSHHGGHSLPFPRVDFETGVQPTRYKDQPVGGLRTCPVCPGHLCGIMCSGPVMATGELWRWAERKPEGERVLTYVTGKWWWPALQSLPSGSFLLLEQSTSF